MTYWFIGLITIPLLLTATEAVPNYASGVSLVLDRSGVYFASKHLGIEATRARNLAMNHVNEFLGATIFTQAAISDR